MKIVDNEWCVHLRDRVRGCNCMFQGRREVDDLYQWRIVPGK